MIFRFGKKRKLNECVCVFLSFFVGFSRFCFSVEETKKFFIFIFLNQFLNK